MSLLRCAILLVGLALAGCNPASQGTVDEQKEPYFLAAKKRAKEGDVQGAIEYFEKTIDGNPRSASAHIELGVIFEQQQNDWASALYHYTRALQIRPDYTSADVIRQRIEYCKRELAKSVVQLPSVEALQRKVDSLTAENHDLRQTLQMLQSYYASRGIAAPSNAVAAAAPPTANITPAPAAGAAPPAAVIQRTETPPARSDTPARGAAPAGTRSHTITSGDTLEKIARRYGVRVSAVLAANPSVDPRRLRPGQTLVIPAPASH